MTRRQTLEWPCANRSTISQGLAGWQRPKERLASGIPSLRLQFTAPFGTFLSVSRAKRHRSRPLALRRQTLANEERFIQRPKLKTRESEDPAKLARPRRRPLIRASQLRALVGEQDRPDRGPVPPGSRYPRLRSPSLPRCAALGGYCCPSSVDDPACS